jgi:hypothetical protein
MGNSPFFPSSSPIHHPSVTSFNTVISSPTLNDNSSEDPEKSSTALAIFLSRKDECDDMENNDLGGREGGDRLLDLFFERVEESCSLSSVSFASSKPIKFSLSFFPRPVMLLTAFEAQVILRPLCLSTLSFSPTVVVLSERFLEALDDGREGGREGGRDDGRDGVCEGGSASDLRLVDLLDVLTVLDPSSSEESTILDLVDLRAGRELNFKSWPTDR